MAKLDKNILIGTANFCVLIMPGEFFLSTRDVHTLNLNGGEARTVACEVRVSEPRLQNEAKRFDIGEKITKSSRRMQVLRCWILWMPPYCAKREKRRVLSNLPETSKGLFTAFQQFLWKAKWVGLSTNRRVARFTFS